jgi:hypothetical protein
MKLSLLIGLLAACQQADAPPAPAASPPGSAGSHGKLELIDAPASPAVDFIKAEVARGKRDGAAVLVYEGAAWCEPCNRFHHAAQTGQLDAEFPKLRLLVFDADKQSDELDRLGYTSEYIPLFAVPGDDGLATGKKLEGGTKGNHAVQELAPRLHALLGT